MKKKAKDIEAILYCFLTIFVIIFIFEVPVEKLSIF